MKFSRFYFSRYKLSTVQLDSTVHNFSLGFPLFTNLWHLTSLAAAERRTAQLPFFSFIHEIAAFSQFYIIKKKSLNVG